MKATKQELLDKIQCIENNAEMIINRLSSYMEYLIELDCNEPVPLGIIKNVCGEC